MTFSPPLRTFGVTVTTRTKAVVAGMVGAVHESITVGSPVTGAPGQPVDTGYLRASWQGVVAPDGWSGVVGTSVAYAPVIEYNGDRSKFNAQGKTPEKDEGGGASRRAIKSTVGGAFSVALTVANADALQAQVVREVRG